MSKYRVANQAKTNCTHVLGKIRSKAWPKVGRLLTT